MSVLTNGFTGQQWVDHFKEKGIAIDPEEEEIIKRVIPTQAGESKNIDIFGKHFSNGRQTAYHAEKIACEYLGYKHITLEEFLLLFDAFQVDMFEKFNVRQIVGLTDPVSDKGGAFLAIQQHRGLKTLGRTSYHKNQSGAGDLGADVAYAVKW
jgi:hypothetical protein